MIWKSLSFASTWLFYVCAIVVEKLDAWNTASSIPRCRGGSASTRALPRHLDPRRRKRRKDSFISGGRNSVHLFLSAPDGSRGSYTAASTKLDLPTATPTPTIGTSSQQQQQQQQPHLVFPGGGIFFYHQAGIVTYLREQGYDLTTPSAITLTGASAGALTATLTATGVDFYQATELALQKALHAGVWDRKEGLQGIWGPMIYDWLDELLPQDALERISDAQEGRQTGLCLLVTPLDKIAGRKERISEFSSRQDLIECNMASIHIPWFLDGRLTRNFRDRPHIDGSFLAHDDDYHPNSPTTAADQLSNSNILVLKHNFDPKYESVGLLDFVDAMAPDGIWRLLEDGKKYAKFLEEIGRLESLPKKGR